MARIYLDRIAATPLHPEALAAMRPFLGEEFGNPSSLHREGQAARAAVDEAREKVAALVGAKPEEIAFTASGSESNNWALKGLTVAYRSKGKHVVVSAVEHLSILNAVKGLERQGVASTVVPVDRAARVDPAAVAAAIVPETVMVSVQAANSEVGTMQAAGEIARICRERKVLFHTDAVAAAGVVPVDVESLGADALSLAGDQFGGPKGAAALYVRRGTRILPLIDGGSQEFGRRAGTENVPAIAGFGAAAAAARRDMAARAASLVPLRDRLLREIPAAIDDVVVTGDPVDRLPHHASFCVRFIEGEAMLLLLDRAGIAAASGSACTAKNLKGSHVLLAIGLEPALAQGSVAFSLLDSTTAEDVAAVTAALPPVVARLRAMSPLYTDHLRRKETAR